MEFSDRSLICPELDLAKTEFDSSLGRMDRDVQKLQRYAEQRRERGEHAGSVIADLKLPKFRIMRPWPGKVDGI